MNKRYLIILALFSIIFGVYFLFKVYENVEKQSYQQLYNEKVVFAKQASRGIESFFEYYEHSLKFLASIDEISELNQIGKKRMADFYLSHDMQITAITRVSKDGKLVYTFPENSGVIGVDLSGQEHNRYLIEQKKPTVSDVITLVQGYKAVVSVYPVFNDGEFDGGISVVIPFSYLARNFLDKLIIGEQGEALVISKNGIAIFAPESGHIGEKFVKNHRPGDGIYTLYQKMMTGSSGVAVFEDKSDAGMGEVTKKHAVFYPMRFGNTYWSISVITTENHVVALMKDFSNNFTYVGVLSFSFFALFMVAFYILEKKYNVKISEAEENYRILTERTGQIFFHYDRITKKLLIEGNSESMIGYTPDEIKKNKFDFWRYNRDKIRQLSRKFKNTPGNFTVDFRFKHKKGYYIYMENSSISIVETGNKKSRFIGAIKDITDRKRLEAELKRHSDELEKIVKLRTAALINLTDRLKEDIKRRQGVEEELISAKELAERSDRLKSEFLAQISHEIRTPINTIMNFVSLIKMEAESFLSDEVREGFVSIDNATVRLLRTIDLVLDMSDVEAGSYEANFVELSLQNDVIRSLFSEFEKRAAEKGLALKVTGDILLEDVKMFLDRYTVTQIFANLIDNAIKYTKSGSVTITVSKTAEDVSVAVSDTGIGIKEEFIPSLFDKFTQEEQGYTRKFEGNGLGLALVKKYCEINNAEIKVTSKKGEGSTFTVVFHPVFLR